ncbi:hypothetical protein [Klebsiella pneumoniae]|uniref:hypothetical protein n=1 Tax=Klebsiella pneumoniae TaxID=573 RepID=UPI000E2C0601|nr:hypothetical protein [Klebsiella pneumoniae]SVW65733.1 Uncharacterised protein [Klebsiella pneumoniae]
MTVSTEVDHNDYTGNGVTTSFPYTFRIFKKSDLTVQVADPNENITVLTLDTDYSVTGAGTYSGGNVVLTSPLANGWQISISRNLPVTQETDLRNQGKFFAEVHEDAFDKLTMLIQQCFGFLRLALRKPSFIANYYDALNNRIRNLRDPSQAQDAATKRYTDVLYNDAIIHADENFNKSVRVTDSSIPSLPAIAIRRNKILAFNNEGNPIVVLPESGSAADVLIELGSSAIPGSSLVMHSDGKTVHQYINILNRRTSFVMPEDFAGTDTQQLLAALSYAKTNGIGRIELIAGKTYTLTGTVGLDIDLGYFSFGCNFGRATIDSTGFTGDGAVWVHSSAPYNDGNRVHSNKMRGVEFKGTINEIGQSLIIIGNKNNTANGTYNGDCHIEDCSFKTCDKVLLATNSTWRYKFINCGFTNEMTGGTHIMHFPAGLADSGESVSFVNCKIYDTKRALLAVDCANFAIGMPGTSVLNCPIEINGAGALIILDSAANIENPGATAWYRYAKVTGVAARLVMNGCTLVCNQPSLQLQPLFEVTPNAFIDYSHVKSPGNKYPFQNGAEGFRTFVEGDGYVIAEGCIADIGSGAGNIPIHKSLNPTRNFGFATGDLTSWSFNNQGSASQTCVVDAAYKKTGSFGARMTSIGSLSCFLTQNVKVTKHNYYTCSLLVNVVTPGTGVSAGGLTVTFYDRSGVKIIDGISSNIPNTVSGWISIGQFIQGRVVQSAEYCEVSIRCREGAVIDVDSFIINFT